jgi:hypothetical protein
MTGTASIFRSRALKTVAAERGHRLPGVQGDVYDTLALTEDNELTIALKSLGGLLISPSECTVVTELMPTFKTLWNQRLRWQRGALENIGAYRLTRETSRYWAQQFGLGYGVAALFSYFAAMIWLVLAIDRWTWWPFWLIIGLVFMVERVITAWAGGWKARILAVLVFPELLFAAFLNLVWLKSVIDITIGRNAEWKHIEHKLDGAVSAQTLSRASALPLLVIFTGILLPEPTLHTIGFGVLTTFVAVNTIMYVALAIAKLLPKVHLWDVFHRKNTRRETRSIDPSAPVDTRVTSNLPAN